MPKDSLRGSPQRVAALSVVVVAVIAGAGILSTWRYEVALNQGSVALDERTDARITSDLATTFWEERNALDTSIARPSPATAAVAVRFRDQFLRLAAQIRNPSDASDEQAVTRALAANARYYAEGTRLRGAAGSSVAQKNAAITRLEAAAPGVVPPLHALARLHNLRANAARAAASTAAGQALATGIAAIVLAIAAGVAFAVLAVRLLRRASHREQDLTTALGRLSDRDDLLARLRSTSAVVGEVTGELRLAAKNASAATSEQSSAVAETSATIEELATTAGSIADNAHAVAKVAERTGDTMRDMQEQGRDHRPARALAGRAGAEDRRDRRADQRHRGADQPARAQRRDRGGQGRGGREGLRGRRRPRCASWPSALCTRRSRSARSSPGCRTRPTPRSWPPRRAPGRPVRSAT